MTVAKRQARRAAAPTLRVHPSTIVPTGPAERFAIDDRVRATDEAPANFAGRVGVIRAVGPRKNEYRVRFGTDKTDVGLLYAQWLKRAGRAR